MHTAAPSLSAQPPAEDRNSTPRPAAILADRWPSLSRAIGQHQQTTAEQFSRIAYDAVEAGIIRHDDRQTLAAAAEHLGIRPFDAQLLIACAVRQWALDRRFDSTPTRHAPALSPEYRSWKRLSIRIALVFIFAATLDGIIIYKWLS